MVPSIKRNLFQVIQLSKKLFRPKLEEIYKFPLSHDQLVLRRVLQLWALPILQMSSLLGTEPEGFTA